MDIISKAECAVCKERLSKDQIHLSNPCAHFFCAMCACQLGKIWEEEGRLRRKCPMCRVHFQDHLFARPYSFTSTKLNYTSLFLWIPRTIFMKQNQGPTLIETLNKKDFDRAFYYMFILNTTPYPIEEKIAPGWTEFYNERKENMRCVSCKAGMPYDQAFAANCSHFYCTVCASFLRESNREGLLRCKKCEQLIEGPEVDVIFLRPFMEPSSMEISEDGVDVVQNQEEEEGEDLQEA